MQRPQSQSIVNNTLKIAQAEMLRPPTSPGHLALLGSGASAHLEGVQEQSLLDAQTTSDSSVQCGGAASLLRVIH